MTDKEPIHVISREQQLEQELKLALEQKQGWRRLALALALERARERARERAWESKDE